MQSRYIALPSKRRNSFGNQARELAFAYGRPAVLAALTFWVLWTGFHLIRKIFDFYTPLPMWDYWRVVEQFNDYRSFHLAAFWRQHNEHRILFPEIAFALDIVLLHGRMLLPIALSTLSYVGTWIVLSGTVISDASLGPFIRVAATLSSALVAFWEGAASVLAVPFLLQWTLMQLAAAVALVGASKLRNPHSRKHLAAVIAACVVASYSSGNGLLVWPLVIAIAIAVRARKQSIAALGVAAVVAIAVYFVHYRVADASKAGNLVRSPLYSIEYVASYLSMPFGAMHSPAFSVKTGVWLCLAVFVCAATAAATRRLFSQSTVVLLGYFCFTFLTAILTAGGRMDPADQQFTAAHAFRYLSVPQMNWSASILLVFSVLSGLSSIRRYLPLLAGTTLLVLWDVFPKLSPWLGGVTSYLAEQQVATLELESGLHDTRWMRAKLFPDPAFADAMLARLKEQKLSIYYGGPNRYLGHPLASIGPVRPARAPGMIVSVVPVESGFQLQGWADQAQGKVPAALLVFADESGEIIGFGRQFPAGLPPVLASPNIPSSLAWVGFVPQRVRSTFVSAYVQAPGTARALYPLGEPVSLPKATPR